MLGEQYTSEIEVKEKRDLELEIIQGDIALTWVKEQNEEIAKVFSGTPEFKDIEKKALAIFEDKNKINYPRMASGFIYNFLMDSDHKQGLLRRTSLEEYKKKYPSWEAVLDIDSLPEKDEWQALLDFKLHSKSGKENWVYRGMKTCYPKGKRTLVKLSLGGGDACVYREFDLETKKFVKEGFQIKEGKSRVSWLDDDTLWIATNFGEDSLTKSGYPRIVKIWKRGESLDQALTVFSGEISDVSVVGLTCFDSDENSTYHCIFRSTDFYNTKSYLVDLKDLSLKLLPFPENITIEAFFNQKIIISLRDDWVVPNGPKYVAGSIVSVEFSSINDPEHLQTAIVFKPTATCVLSSVSKTKNYLLLKLLNNVSGELYQCGLKDKTWSLKRLPLPNMGNASLISCDRDTDDCFVGYTDFLTPDSLYFYDATKDTMELIKTKPSYFNEEKMEVKQLWATSKDGTKIPYFVVHPKNMKLDGKNPTLLYGYGGFEKSMLPSYVGSMGRFWLEQGGVYILANIRGGGEFGPYWHKSVLKEHRHKVFEDFIAVAEDLIQLKITSPKHLGIHGGSNGGLLVGAVAIQRPELFNAVICQAPLLDMLNYHTMLAGNSWVAEYGDPSDPKMHNIIKQYSPYHNVLAEKSYPRILFTSSTKDDRVHPGHAVYYYENIEGGHGGASNLKQSAFKTALIYCYLNQQLKPKLTKILESSSDVLPKLGVFAEKDQTYITKAVEKNIGLSN